MKFDKPETSPVWSKWVKIGQVTRITGVWKSGTYSEFTVMERIHNETGMREYKEIFICSAMHHITLTPQPA